METTYEENLFSGRENVWNRIESIYIGLMTIKTLDLINSVTTIKDKLELEIVNQNGEFDSGAYIDMFKKEIVEVYKSFGLVIEDTAPLSVFEAIVETVKVVEDTEKVHLQIIENIKGSDFSMLERLTLLVDDLLPGKYDEIELLDNLDLTELFFDNIIYVIYNNKMSKTPPNPKLLGKICELSLKIPEITNSNIFKDIISGDHIEEYDLDYFPNVEYVLSTMETPLDTYGFIYANSTPNTNVLEYIIDNNVYDSSELDTIKLYEEMRVRDE